MNPEQIIIKDADILGGTPVFRGTRVPFQALLDYLEGGQTLDEFLDDFPTVSKEAAVAALELAKIERRHEAVRRMIDFGEGRKLSRGERVTRQFLHEGR